MTRKGIILAGGSGTRLYPATRAISKQLMPVHDKPMIYYPLSTLMLTGIRDILIISTPRDVVLFRDLLGDGSRWGIDISYAEQPAPEGLAQAFVIGRDFIGKDPVAMILGDNLYYGQGLPQLLYDVSKKDSGATVFGYRVSNPESYGVISFDSEGQPVDVIEKPKNPASKWAVTGFYFYDNDVIDIARSLKPSARNELEITDVNRIYLQRRRMDVVRLGRGYAWFDTGTHETLANATEFVRIMEQRQGLKLGCPEEIAYALGHIDEEAVLKIASEMGKTGYAEYLRELVGPDAA
jgi:glucose-1-phosphate thymidylyltransferase